MADQHRTSSESLDRLRMLQDEPHRYTLLSAIRLLDCMLGDPQQTGRASRPSKESLRIGQRPSLTFAPSSIASIQSRASDGKLLLQTYFLGLFGPNGPLPTHFSDFADQRIKHHRDPTFAAFVDIFHHRMASFFYRAWAASQPTVHLDRPESDRFSDYVASLCGLGLKSLRNRDQMPDNAKLFFAAHLAAQTRHAAGLKSILAAFYQVNAELIPLVSHWVQLPEDCIWKVGRTRHSGELGRSITLGTRVRDCQQRFRIVLGPLDFEPYCKLLPNGASMKRLRSIVDQYVGLELTWDVQLVLKSVEVPQIRLGRQGQLGWTTWLSTRTPPADADELIVNPIGRSEKYYKSPSRQKPGEHLESLTSGV
jgi:type VI secretion system protein ImpH